MDDAIAKNQFKKAQLQIRGAQTIAKKSGSLYEINKCRLEQGIIDFSHCDLHGPVLRQLD